MRRIAALLLLVLLPGLLLPAGLWLHVCSCDTAASTVRTCCQASAARPEPQRTCCHRHVRRDAPACPQPSAQPDDCGCTWVPLPDTPTPKPPSMALWLPPCLPPPLLAIVTPPPARIEPPAVPRSMLRLRAPPPGSDRNLPLRL